MNKRGTVIRLAWAAVPLVTLGLLSWLPFVIAAYNGYIPRWVPAVYAVTTVVLYLLAGNERPWVAALLLALMCTAAVHTWLMGSKPWTYRGER